MTISWGCELLAETSKPGPRLYAITAPQLSDSSKESKCWCLPLTRIAPKHSLLLLPKPDSLQGLAYEKHENALDPLLQYIVGQ